MKNLDLITDAIKAMNEGNNEVAENRLKQFITLNTPRVNGGKFKIYDWCDAKSVYRYAKGVYHDSEAESAVATDTHALIISKNDYDPEHSGKCIDKKGDEVKSYHGDPLTYPNWRRVFYDNRREFKVDREKIAKMLTQERADKKLGKIYFAFNVGTPEDTKYLSSANCKLLLTLPEDGKFYVSAGEFSEKLALQYESTDGNYKALFMPMEVKPKYVGQDAITINELT